MRDDLFTFDVQRRTERALVLLELGMLFWPAADLKRELANSPFVKILSRPVMTGG